MIADPQVASGHEVLHFAWTNTWAVRKGDWKLIAMSKGKNPEMKFSLHNLAEENPEKKDHAEEHPKSIRRSSRR